MYKREILNKFKGGLSYGDDYQTVELLVDKRHTKDDFLALQAYDAALMGLPPVEKWNKDAQAKLKAKILECFKDYPTLTVTVDDQVIKAGERNA